MNLLNIFVGCLFEKLIVIESIGLVFCWILKLIHMVCFVIFFFTLTYDTQDSLKLGV